MEKCRVCVYRVAEVSAEFLGPMFLNLTLTGIVLALKSYKICNNVL